MFEIARTVYSRPVPLTVEVSPSTGSGTPTGTVTFFDGSSTFGTGNLVNGVATLSTIALALGSNNITVEYSGYSNYIGGSAIGGTIIVSQDNSTVSVYSSDNPTTYGTAITFTAQASPAYPGFGTPTGSVTFYDSFNKGTRAPLATATLSSGTATFSTSSLAVGSHDISVVYSGDTNFLASSDTSDVSETVNPSVMSVAVNNGQTQRSMVMNLEVTFTGTVSPSLLTNAFTLTRIALPNGEAGDNALIGSIAVSSSTNGNGNTVATLTFFGNNTEAGSLADGSWVLEFDSNQIATVNRLFGDYQGTGNVDSTDLGVFGTTFGLTSSSPSFLAAFDSDGNGIIDSTDLGRFGTNFGLSI